MKGMQGIIPSNLNKLKDGRIITKILLCFAVIPFIPFIPVKLNDFECIHRF
jgi:hypothetical protein